MFIAGSTGLVGLVFSLAAFFRAAGCSGSGASRGYIDPRFKRILWYLIASSKGGVNTAKIIDMVNSRWTLLCAAGAALLNIGLLVGIVALYVSSLRLIKSYFTWGRAIVA